VGLIVLLEHPLHISRLLTHYIRFTRAMNFIFSEFLRSRVGRSRKAWEV
jgi:hypothetical protein